MRGFGNERILREKGERRKEKREDEKKMKRREKKRVFLKGTEIRWSQTASRGRRIENLS